jgi:hypothetical protein
MGGNALKKTTTRRYSAKEYLALRNQVIRKLQPLLPDCAMDDIKHYRQKPDFGDLDILIEDKDTKNRLINRLSDISEISELVTHHENSPVWSAGWGDFQVDLIFAEPNYYDFTSRYFAYNDLGNLIGRVAHHMGFKFGSKGLIYVLMDGDFKIGEITVTLDFEDALTFLGFGNKAHSEHQEGFDTLEEMFEYISESYYFEPNFYRLETRSNSASARDRKRPIYQAFLRHIEGMLSFSNTLDKDEHLHRAFAFFASFKGDHDNLLLSHEISLIFKARFNGEMVSRITGLKHIELGRLMEKLRAGFADKLALQQWVLNNSDQVIEDWVLKLKNELMQLSCQE